MTSAGETAAADRHERERREADHRYNDALTALDRAIVAAGARPATGRDDLLALASTLIVFLQQITAFVESKDREVAARADARMTRIEQGLEPIAELTARLSVLQRAVEGIARDGRQSLVERRQSQSAVASHEAVGAELARPAIATGQLPATSNQQPRDHLYVAFEDQFRGSDAAVAEKLRAYVPIFAGARDVVDLGCGRGELLAALQAAGISGRGVDANADMAAIARERGLDAAAGDALGFLDAIPDASLGGIAATQVVEHLEPAYLVRLLDAAARTLRPGAPIVLETINPACWLAFFSSYLRDLTHVRPVHPETLQYLLRASGFERVEIRYSAPVPDHMKMKTTDLPAAIVASAEPTAAALAAVAHAVNANAVILNNLMFTHLDYAAIGYRV
jgi:SAM-dependent methyltransferase